MNKLLIIWIGIVSGLLTSVLITNTFGEISQDELEKASKDLQQSAGVMNIIIQVSKECKSAVDLYANHGLAEDKIRLCNTIASNMAVSLNNFLDMERTDIFMLFGLTK